MTDQAGICEISHEVHEESLCWAWDSWWWSWRGGAHCPRS